MISVVPNHSNNGSSSIDLQDHLLKLAEVAENEPIPTIPLLEERLAVHRYKNKVGEVIVRKEIETQIIRVPIRREKLVVEQITPEHKQIAVFDLGSHQVSLKEMDATDDAMDNIKPDGCLIKSEFDTIKLANQFLAVIAHLTSTECKSVEISIKVENELMREVYQQSLEKFLSSLA